MKHHTWLPYRLLSHTLVWRPSYKRMFNAQCLSNIAQSVKRCEASTQVQVCVITEQTLPYSYLFKRLSTRQRAITLFGKHRVWDTALNSGVLIYVNMVEHAVELVADRGIAPLIEQTQWDAWAQQLNAACAKQQFESGLMAVIHSMCPVFERTLPKKTVRPDDELPNAPIVL